MALGPLGLLLTVLWLGFAFWYVSEAVGFENLLLLLPQEIALFVIGVVLPLGVLWFILAFFRFGRSLGRIGSRDAEAAEASPAAALARRGAPDWLDRNDRARDDEGLAGLDATTPPPGKVPGEPPVGEPGDPLARDARDDRSRGFERGYRPREHEPEDLDSPAAGRRPPPPPPAAATPPPAKPRAEAPVAESESPEAADPDADEPATQRRPFLSRLRKSAAARRESEVPPPEPPPQLVLSELDSIPPDGVHGPRRETEPRRDAWLESEPDGGPPAAWEDAPKAKAERKADAGAAPDPERDEADTPDWTDTPNWTDARDARDAESMSGLAPGSTPEPAPQPLAPRPVEPPQAPVAETAPPPASQPASQPGARAARDAGGQGLNWPSAPPPPTPSSPAAATAAPETATPSRPQRPAADTGNYAGLRSAPEDAVDPQGEPFLAIKLGAGAAAARGTEGAGQKSAGQKSAGQKSAGQKPDAQKTEEQQPEVQHPAGRAAADRPADPTPPRSPDETRPVRAAPAGGEAAEAGPAKPEPRAADSSPPRLPRDEDDIPPPELGGSGGEAARPPASTAAAEPPDRAGSAAGKVPETAGPAEAKTVAAAAAAPAPPPATPATPTPTPAAPATAASAAGASAAGASAAGASAAGAETRSAPVPPPSPPTPTVQGTASPPRSGRPIGFRHLVRITSLELNALAMDMTSILCEPKAHADTARRYDSGERDAFFDLLLRKLDDGDPATLHATLAERGASELLTSYKDKFDRLLEESKRIDASGALGRSLETMAVGRLHGRLEAVRHAGGATPAAASLRAT